MAVGDITSTVTEYATMAALNTFLDAQSTGAATAGADTTTYFIIPGANCSMFYLVKVVRAAA
jgi:hypothetical protein